MKKKTIRVWAIYYRIRLTQNSKWDSWVGPLGVYCLSSIIPSNLTDMLGGRPCFTRTRQQARDIAKKKSYISNKTWTWVQYTVRPIRLTWEEL